MHVVDATYEIVEDVMKEIYNSRRRDTQSCMIPSSLLKSKLLLAPRQNAAAQQFGKKAFSAYLFQLSGSKFLLHKLIQLPILPQCTMVQSSSSAEPPAALLPMASVLMQCVKDLQEHKKTDEYKAAVKRSQKRASDESRLSKQIYEQTK